MPSWNFFFFLVKKKVCKQNSSLEVMYNSHVEKVCSARLFPQPQPASFRLPLPLHLSGASLCRLWGHLKQLTESRLFSPLFKHGSTRSYMSLCVVLSLFLPLSGGTEASVVPARAVPAASHFCCDNRTAAKVAAACFPTRASVSRMELLGRGNVCFEFS